MRLRDHGRRAVLTRARLLARSRGRPARTWSASASACASSCARSARARAGGCGASASVGERRALVIARKADAALLDCRERRPRELERLALALAAHDPQRTLERGYALVESPDGQPLTTAAGRARARELRLRFADAHRRGAGPRAMSAPAQRASPQPAQAPLTYEAASARVEEIIRRLDSGEASLDETLALVSEGKG